MLQSSRFIGVLSLALVAGCSLGDSHPSTSSPSVKKGELGNGGFTFRCDDSVACDRWHNADNFPKAVALGSTFELQFLLVDGGHGYTWLKDAERGTTVEGVGKYITRGASGFAAVSPGIATISARDQKGWLVDYTTVRVRKPDSLIIYDADYTGDNPTRLARVSFREGERKSFRVVAQAGVEALAGSVTVEWTSDDDGVAAIEGYSRGKVTVVATGPTGSSTTLRARGGGDLAQTMTVTIGTATTTDGGAGNDAGTDAAKEGSAQ